MNASRPIPMPRSHAARRVRPGYTLVEIMIVISIILVMMGVVVGAGAYGFRAVKTSRTKAILAVLEQVATEYKNETGDYPVCAVATTSKGFLEKVYYGGSTVTPPISDAATRDGKFATGKCGEFLVGLRGSFDPINATVKDAWGNEIEISTAGAVGTRPVFKSKGANTADAADDLYSNLLGKPDP